jgi:phosphohistidine phosphatase
MKTLYLLRHAKSSWGDATLADFDRPLNERGKRASEAIGNYLKSNSITPELIICSTALRTRETLAIVTKTAELNTEVRYDERIYEASRSRLAEVISEIENDRNVVMLIGHNPGMEEILLLLTGKRQEMSTGTLAKIVFDTMSWTTTVEKRGTLESIVSPRELERE